MSAYETFTRNLQQQITWAGTRIAEFKMKLDENPARAFDWAKDAMSAAASASLNQEVLEFFERRTIRDHVSIEQAAEEARVEFEERLIRAARSATSLSTSAVSNVMDAHRLAADADMLNAVRRLVRGLKIDKLSAELSLDWITVEDDLVPFNAKTGRQFPFRIRRQTPQGKMWGLIRVGMEVKLVCRSSSKTELQQAGRSRVLEFLIEEAKL